MSLIEESHGITGNPGLVMPVLYSDDRRRALGDAVRRAYAVMQLQEEEEGEEEAQVVSECV